jgi:hypothetical protein
MSLRFTKTVTAFFILSLLSACSSKIFEPLYTTVPLLPKAPSVSFIAERTTPPVEREQLVISLKQESKPGEDEFFNNPGAARKADGKSPSVILSVPEEPQNDNALLKTQGTNNYLDEVFKTVGYYNEAEQAIEVALLRKGFNVLDRSKFEAKLRNMRDRANSSNYWWSSYNSLIEKKDYQAIKDILANQVKEGAITQAEYLNRLAEIDQNSQLGWGGSKRSEDEMNDIAEVIRVAETGNTQASYILQINSVSVSEAGHRPIEIRNKAEVLAFLEANPGIQIGKESNMIPFTVDARWLQVMFSAKLIDINTGSIVWLGTHELESWVAEDIKIVFDVQRSVNNGEEVNNGIRKHNAAIRAKSEEVAKLTGELKVAYESAMVKQKFETKSEVSQFKNELQQKIKNLEGQIETKEKELAKLVDYKPAELDREWTYTYVVSKPIILPDLLADGEKSIEGQQTLLKHRRELIKVVTQQLIDTITIEKADTIEKSKTTEKPDKIEEIKD